MGNKKSIKYEIGFSDSEIISYHSENENLIILLKCWNEKVLRIEFVDCILFFILSSWNISDICESNNSALFQKAVEKVYETIPENYNYRLFQFFDNDDDLVVEIACKNIIITKKIKIYLSSNGMNLSYKYNINGALTKKTTPFGIIDMHYNNSGLHETIHTQLLNHS